MSTEQDALLLNDPKVKSAGSTLFKFMMTVAVCGLFVTALFLLHPFAVDKAATNVLIRVAENNVSPAINVDRTVIFIAADFVVEAADALSDVQPMMTHLVVSGIQNLDRRGRGVSDIQNLDRRGRGVAETQRLLSAVQAHGVKVLLALDDQAEDFLRQHMTSGAYSVLLDYIDEWSADGLDISMMSCLDPNADDTCADTSDVMRLVSALRADLRDEFMITLSAKARAVFDSDHSSASRNNLRELVLDEMDWVNVHFEGGWTEVMAQELVNAMQEKVYESDVIVPVMTYSESTQDNEGCLSLSQLREKYGTMFGGFGLDAESVVQEDCEPCSCGCC